MLSTSSGCFRVLTALFLATTGLAQRSLPEADGSIHRLPDALAEKTLSLNPEYFVSTVSVANTNKPLPLLIFLHGGGGVGQDIERIARQSGFLRAALRRHSMDSLFVAPQAAHSPRKFGGSRGGWQVADLDLLLAHLLQTLPVDPDRIYLTGISMGGYGTLMWAGYRPEHFAAISPMVGGLGPAGPKDITEDLDLWGRNLAKIPLRAYYGAKDRVVPPDRGEMIREAIKHAGGKQAEVIILPDKGHDAASVPYSQPEFFRWLYSHRK
ncbi:MAG: prolyl oligopeptidase family serine peptidase [Coraliomargaritaceae bacterium]